jgi:aspartate/methionine/tyrosine aminotransferase
MASMARFSNRTPESQRLNPLAEERARIHGSVIDLTESNPTRCGFDYPPDLLMSLADRRALVYEPDPRGPAAARERIAEDSRRSGVPLTPDRVVLTASTSEAYGMLFKLLADPGDSVLAPTPSYPLFDQLARLDGIRLAPYRLLPDEAWRPDTTAMDSAPDRCRGLIVVNPNNPTGSYISRTDAEDMAERCRRNGWSLISDEVFLPFALDDHTGSHRGVAGAASCLTFTLGGLSKSIGLPQAKLAWIAISGPDEEVVAALDRLDYIADAYLSVGTPVATAASSLLELGGEVRDQIRSRCRANADRLVELTGGESPVSLIPPQGGWNAVLRVPAIVDDERFALGLLRRRSTVVHPGYLFDFPSDGFLVISLIVPEELFAEGIRRLLEHTHELVDTRP